MRNYCTCFILLIIITFSVKSLAQDDLTIKEVLSYNFPSGLVVSETGDLAAWIENKEGRRNIFISDGNSPGKQITSYQEDDGQQISNLIINPDNKSIIFIRGGAPNRKGEIPNPMSLPERVKRQIWEIDIEDKSLKLIAEGSSPALSHNGKLLVFIKNGQVWKINLDKNEEPKHCFSIRGNVGSLRWSPDDKKLAFVSNRSDHAFIGIYFFETNKIKYLNPSVDIDSYPVWSPDSRRIAFIRIPNERNTLPFFSKRAGLPWSIHVGEISSGSSKEIWKANEGTGSVFRYVSSSNQLLWGANEHLVFPWEGDGWTNLYSIKTNGSDLKLISPGKSEVKFVSISPDKERIIYSSNKGDIDRQHIWSSNITTGKTEQLTNGEGIEWSPQLSLSNKLYLLASGPTTPAFPAQLENKKIKSLLTNSKVSDYPKEKLVKPKQVIYTSTDGMKIHGQLFLPKNVKSGEKYPAIIFIHGGSRRQMFLGFHHGHYYHNAYAFNQFLANRGYVVLSVNFRSGIGYGMKFREAINYGPDGASEFSDILGAGLYLKNQTFVDPDQIGLYGGSYGGYLTAMGLAKASNLYAAGVDLFGLHDWNIGIKHWGPNYDPLKMPKIAEKAYNSSPIAYVKSWKSPVLLVHGDDDRNVPFSETVTLIEELRKNNVDIEQLIFPDEVHVFLIHAKWIKTFEVSFDFFERKLKNKEL